MSGTPLLVPGGVRGIDQFKVGDPVLSRDEWDPEGEASVEFVEEVFEGVGEVFHLTVGGRTIGTTAAHPFWVEGRGWVEAHQLQPGDVLGGHDRQPVSVQMVRATGELAPVYNLRISNRHTYFVGRDEWGFSVWAHNTCIYHGTDAASAANIVAIGLNLANWLAFAATALCATLSVRVANGLAP